MGASFGGQLCSDPLSLAGRLAELNLPSAWFGKPNSFLCPSGTRPGSGWLLLPRGALDALDFNQLYDLVFTSQEDATSGRPRPRSGTCSWSMPCA